VTDVATKIARIDQPINFRAAVTFAGVPTGFA